MRLRPPASVCAVALAIGALGSACSAPAEVSPPVPPDRAEAPCAALADALPPAVVEQQARATEPDSLYTAAWGEPAIELRCGVPRPAALTPTSQLISINDVDWFAEELTGGYLFTTYGRVAYVEVAVPDDYSPEVGPVTEISAAVAETVPTVTVVE